MNSTTPNYITTPAPNGMVRVSCTRGHGTIGTAPESDNFRQRRIALNHQEQEHTSRKKEQSK